MSGLLCKQRCVSVLLGSDRMLPHKMPMRYSPFTAVMRSGVQPEQEMSDCRDTGGTGQAMLRQRANLMFQTAGLLKRLADTFQLAVLVVNQVKSGPCSFNLHPGHFQSSEQACFRPP